MKILRNQTLFFRLKAGDPFYLNGVLCMKVNNPDSIGANNLYNSVQVGDGQMRFVDHNVVVEIAPVHVANGKYFEEGD